ncbi:MAG TPA: inositol monophosphatase family protein [Fimbriiglobus sp.]|jgi:histidinol-phosphatase
MNPDWSSRYEVAVTAAKQGGDLARSIFDTAFDVEWKEDNSPVTVADKGAERAIRALVARHFPNDGFLGEEDGHVPGTTGFRWIVDPIDGTRSYVRHIPIWATLVGLEYKGEQIGGVAYVPCLGEMYRALRGDGAYCNDRPIRVSPVTELSKALLCYSSIGWFRKAGKERTFLELAAKTERQRGFGDFYGFVLVASGSADAMVEHGVRPWDVAATKALVEEAGGRFTDWDGNCTIDRPDVLATNGHLHDAVRTILNG